MIVGSALEVPGFEIAENMMFEPAEYGDGNRKIHYNINQFLNEDTIMIPTLLITMRHAPSIVDYFQLIS